MKKIILLSSLGLCLFAAGIYSFTPQKTIVNTNQIEWLTLEEAIVKNKANPKKIFIDFYTDWCGWCKVMDKKTFTDPQVIKYMNENFYAVKFDAEQQQEITFNGKKYQFLKGGRKGIHSLAYTLLDQRASYPSFVMLDENLNRLGIIKGYKTPQQFLPIVKQYLNNL